MSEAPKECLYCDQQGNSTAGGLCGFCENGKPLDTQEDWDASWGKIQDESLRFLLSLPEVDQDKIIELIKLVRSEKENK